VIGIFFFEEAKLAHVMEILRHNSNGKQRTNMHNIYATLKKMYNIYANEISIICN
jgi:hypothetical protein